jgi:hypothetical protein
VQPVVALPGWFVRRANSHHIPVLAVGEIPGYFASRPKQPEMSAQLVRQIVQQLDQKSRDAALRSHERPEKVKIGVRARNQEKAEIGL